MSSATTYRKCVFYEQNMSKTFSYFLQLTFFIQKKSCVFQHSDRRYWISVTDKPKQISIHPVSIIASPALSVGGCWSQSQLSSGQGGLHPGQIVSFSQGHIEIQRTFHIPPHTHGQFRVPNVLIGGSQSNRRKTQTAHRKGPAQAINPVLTALLLN